jgi:hypothetical protein
MNKQRVALAMFAFSLALTMPSEFAVASGSHNHSHSQMHGELREIPAGKSVPSIKLEAVADMSDGYNLHLVVKNFTFSPALTGEHTEAVEGHAHLYVNGDKVGRVYSTWVHLPAKLLELGENEIRVSLNDNRHRAWAIEGMAIEAVAVLAATQ